MISATKFLDALERLGSHAPVPSPDRGSIGAMRGDADLPG
jgi:hypothetical protein